MRMRAAARAMVTATLAAGALGCGAGPEEAGSAGGAPDSAGAPTGGAAQPAPVAAPSPPLVDTTIAPAIAGEDGWGFTQEVQADLDSDGEPERVVLTARVEMVRGRPAWDDGQPWQVYVEEGDGRRTYLYSRFVQLGTVTMRVGLAEPGVLPSVVVLEQLPDRMSVHEVQYDGPGDVTIVARYQRALDPTGDVAAPALP